jgi:hypothetical protein
MFLELFSDISMFTVQEKAMLPPHVLGLFAASEDGSIPNDFGCGM